jgi:hypothetical protein
MSTSDASASASAPAVIRAIPLSIRPPTPLFKIDLSPESLAAADSMRRPPRTHATPPAYLDGKTADYPQTLAKEILEAGQNLTSFQAFSIANALQAWSYNRGHHETGPY